MRAFDVVEAWLQDVVDARQAALAQVAVFGKRGAVLEAHAFVVFGKVLVVWLRKAVCQVVQLLWQPDRL